MLSHLAFAGSTTSTDCGAQVRSQASVRRWGTSQNLLCPPSLPFNMTPINDKLEFLEILEDRDLSNQLGRVQATYYGAYKLQTTNNIYEIMSPWRCRYWQVITTAI